MAKKPRCLIAHADCALELVGAHSLACFTEQQDGHKPRFQRQFGVPEDRASRNAKLIRALGALKQGFAEPWNWLTASDTLRTRGPAQTFQEFSAATFIGETRHEIDQSHTRHHAKASSGNQEEIEKEGGFSYRPCRGLAGRSVRTELHGRSSIELAVNNLPVRLVNVRFPDPAIWSVREALGLSFGCVCRVFFGKLHPFFKRASYTGFNSVALTELRIENNLRSGGPWVVFFCQLWAWITLAVTVASALLIAIPPTVRAFVKWIGAALNFAFKLHRWVFEGIRTSAGWAFHGFHLLPAKSGGFSFNARTA